MNMKINISEKIFLPTIIALMVGFVVLDQSAKKIALSSLSISSFYLNDYFSLEISRNYGIAFGFYISAEVFYFIVFAFFVWLIRGKILDFKEMNRKDILGIGLILSGALGNIIDRVRFGYIIDYINFKNIVIFNLADVFILLGAIILLEDFFPNMRKSKIKKNIYIALFAGLGVLISFLIHAAIEIWYIGLLLQDFSKYGLGLSWPQWHLIHGIGTVILLVGGIFFGYTQGRYWWKILYEKR